MERKSNYILEQKVEAVLDYKSGKRRRSQLCSDLDSYSLDLSRWVHIDDDYGELGFLHKTRNKTYAKELKEAAIHDYLCGKGSYRKIANKYEISSPAILKKCYALDKADIQLGRGRLLIQKAQGSTTDKLNTQKATKTPHSVRAEPIVPELEEILIRLIDSQPNEHLFAMYNGEVVDTDLVGNKIRYVCRKIGIEFNLYRLRHKFSTDLVTANVDKRTIMELMGHNNIGQTLEYARSNDDLKNEALKNRKYS